LLGIYSSILIRSQKIARSKLIPSVTQIERRPNPSPTPLSIYAHHMLFVRT
jgi:hypothetical protein